MHEFMLFKKVYIDDGDDILSQLSQLLLILKKASSMNLAEQLLLRLK